jgi:hypothetical protein
MTVPEPRPDASKGPALGGLRGIPADRISEETGNAPYFFLGHETELRALIESPGLKPLNRQLRFAACRGMDPEVYHPDHGQPGELALTRCTSCRARLACLALALRSEDPDVRSGWYGGLSPEDRNAVAASLDIEKTESTSTPDSAARAVELRRAGWTIGAIAVELGCCRRTVHRYLR